MMNTTSDSAAYFRRNVENSRLAKRNRAMLNAGDAGGATFGIRISTRSADVSVFGEGGSASGGCIGALAGSRDRNRGLIGEKELLITVPSCRYPHWPTLLASATRPNSRGRRGPRIEGPRNRQGLPQFRAVRRVS
jgi:hypothetical protein